MWGGLNYYVFDIRQIDIDTRSRTKVVDPVENYFHFHRLYLLTKIWTWMFTIWTLSTSTPRHYEHTKWVSLKLILCSRINFTPSIIGLHPPKTPNTDFQISENPCTRISKTLYPIFIFTNPVPKQRAQERGYSPLTWTELKVIWLPSWQNPFKTTSLDWWWVSHGYNFNFTPGWEFWTEDTITEYLVLRNRHVIDYLSS